MDDPKSLADYLDVASAKRDTASGRALAQIAAKGGYTISHSTINRIRRGDYGSAPTTEVLEAIAFLSGVPIAKVRSADDVHRGRSPDVVSDEWRRITNKLIELEIEYARLRGISHADAVAELTGQLESVLGTRRRPAERAPLSVVDEAARASSNPSKGEQIRRRDETLGEESQIDQAGD